MRKANQVAATWLSGLVISGGLLAGCGTSSGANTAGASNGSSANSAANSSGQNASQNTSTANTTSSAATSANSSDKHVTIGYINWPEDAATADLWKYLLDKKGYKVSFKQLTPGPMYEAVASGGIDIFNDVWLPNADKQYMTRYGSKYIEAGKWFQPTREGIVVPKYVKNVNSLADLNAHASEFNNQIVGIEPGAGETTLIEHTVIPKYGIKLKLVNSSGTAMIASLQKAIKAHKPVAVVLWSPYWVFAKWNLKFLNDPKDAFGDTKHPGWIENIVNKKWGQQHQQVVTWMKNFKMKPNDLDSLELDIKTAGGDSQKGVKKWIADNQSLVNSWFKK